MTAISVWMSFSVKGSVIKKPSQDFFLPVRNSFLILGSSKLSPENFLSSVK